jgi:hypothetical protein
MSICRKDCKYNKNNFCRYYKNSILCLQGNDTYCLAYKKQIEKPVRNQIKRNSIKQEKKLAKDLGAKRQPQSGAKDAAPADMIKGNYIIESKATNKDSIVLHKEWLDQLKQSPINYGKVPTLIIDFTKTNDRYVVLDMVDFQKIIKGESNE